jgi:hypothetical protein
MGFHRCLFLLFVGSGFLSSARASLHGHLPALKLFLCVCPSWLISVIAVQPFGLLFHLATSVPIAVRTVAITTPFSVAKWCFIVFSLSTIMGLLITEPVSIVFGSSRRSFLLHEAGVFV